MERGRLCHGPAAALVTPFRNGAVNDDCLARLCERQVVRGTNILVVCGSTGEAAALRPAEHARVVQIAVEAAAGRVPVMAGCNALNTADAADLAMAAIRHGAAAVLCAPPPYVRPTQEGIIAHVGAVRAAADCAVMLYDVPARTGVTVTDDAVARLFEPGLIFGIKDATADLARPSRLRRRCGAGFVQMTGDDATASAYRAAGGHGCISVTANIAPALCRALHAACTDTAIQDRLAPLTEALFAESNPISVKAALALLGLAGPDTRLPLTPAASATIARLAQVLPAVMAAEDALAARPYAMAS